MEAEDVLALAVATEKLQANPSWIHEQKELAFLLDFALSWGAKLPTAGGAPRQPPAAVHIDLNSDAEVVPEASAPLGEEVEVHEDTVIESDTEADEERLPEEKEPLLPLPAKCQTEPSEVQLQACMSARDSATAALESGDISSALEKYTEALMTGAASALLYAKRADLLLKQKRPLAAIADCSAALEVNPDSGKACRIRGIANRRLGRWEAAHKDLLLAQKLDFDEGSVAVQKLVAEKVQRLREKRGQERANRRDERESAKRRRKV